MSSSSSIMKVPATGLSRFVGNYKQNNYDVKLAEVPATGLSRFVGNLKQLIAFSSRSNQRSLVPATGLSRFVGNT